MSERMPAQGQRAADLLARELMVAAIEVAKSGVTDETAGLRIIMSRLEPTHAAIREEYGQHADAIFEEAHRIADAMNGIAQRYWAGELA